MGFSSRRIEEREKKHCLHTCYSNLFNVFFFLFSRRIDERENIVSTPIIQISSMFSSFSSRGESMKKKEHCLHTCYSNLFNAFFFLFSRRIDERENTVSTPLFESLQRLLLSLLEERVGFSSRRIDERERTLSPHLLFNQLFNNEIRYSSKSLQRLLLSLLEERVGFSSRRIDERERTLSPHVLFKSLQRLLLSLLEKNQRKREHCLHTCYSNLFNAFFFLFSKRGLVEVEVEEETNRGGKKS